jgi:acyl carrier protein
VFAATRKCERERKEARFAKMQFAIGPCNGVMSDPADPIRKVVFDTLRASTSSPVVLSDQTNIVNELGLDSVAIMDFVMEIEDRLDISVPLDRIAEVETIGDLVATMRDLESRG